MVDAELGSDKARGGDERRMFAENERGQGVVEVDNGQEGIEGTFGEAAFGSGAGGRR